jgi:hypothetical protein
VIDEAAHSATSGAWRDASTTRTATPLAYPTAHGTSTRARPTRSISRPTKGDMTAIPTRYAPTTVPASAYE